jgi:hypothetical protein
VGPQESGYQSGVVADAGDGVQLSITKQEVQDLPAVNAGPLVHGS